MKLSVQTSVYFRYPLKEAIQCVADMGFQGVEIWGNRPHFFVYDMKKEEIRELRRFTEDLGMEISCFTPSRSNPRSPVNISSSDEKIRRESVGYLKECIRCAVDLGTKIVCVVPGYYLYGGSKKEGLDQTVQSINELADCAEDNDINIAIENLTKYESNIVVTLNDVLDILDRVSSRNLGVLMDVGHLNVTGEPPVDYLKAIGERILLIHIDDNNGESDAHLIPGEGTINFESLLTALKRNEYDGYLSFELGSRYILNPDSAVFKSKRTMEKLIKQLGIQNIGEF